MASADTLMKQASDTSEVYIQRAIKFFGLDFNKEFTDKEIKLISIYVQAASADFAAMAQFIDL